jgi:hypothetical protein
MALQTVSRHVCLLYTIGILPIHTVVLCDLRRKLAQLGEFRQYTRDNSDTSAELFAPKDISLSNATVPPPPKKKKKIRPSQNIRLNF